MLLLLVSVFALTLLLVAILPFVGYGVSSRHLEWTLHLSLEGGAFLHQWFGSPRCSLWRGPSARSAPKGDAVLRHHGHLCFCFTVPLRHVGLADYGAALALWTPAAREEHSLGASLAQDPWW
ncbi:unnamed protein product [Polarella glacialis]|uniref:Uncharacterized protein n=1 Tax=Polarella glacialis TaxID=89957 RepID=A0A813EBN8_POLGL|nr:unnamed protein product [Polarella glacialis]